jgi:hypothetical protein
VRRGLALAGWLAAGCLDRDGDFGRADTFRFDSGPDDGVPCVDVLHVARPTDLQGDVDVTAPIEVHVREGAEEVVFALQSERGAQYSLEVAVHRSSAGRLFVLTTPTQLSPGGVFIASAVTESEEIEVDGQMRTACTRTAAARFTVRGERPEVAASPTGEWWIDGTGAPSAGAAVWNRVLPMMGNGYGLAARVGLRPVGGGVELSLGSLRREFGFPDHEDAVEVVTGTWRGGWFDARAGDWQIDDGAEPLVVRGARLTGQYDAALDRLESVQIQGRLDLRAWRADRLAAACTASDMQGIGCSDCGDGVVACLNVDARVMTAVRR